ncbi:putative quinol monooxygenase [uncultured Faecalibaculum sp.]|uniref:putative quinol monooxygenase n=1 Tax=uncultured Faecalibaculum sp. TaxID=1729681 RepID=UPI0026004491|nr:putative quinol monooxygenase [uncultured Faecalibaculum sp.]
MSLTVNLYYTGENGSALAFVREMEESGIARAIREEEGNEKYDYFQSVRDPETVLLIDQWRDQTALDAHHATPMMQQLAALRDKYNLHMRVERYRDAEENPADEAFLRR